MALAALVPKVEPDLLQRTSLIPKKKSAVVSAAPRARFQKARPNVSIAAKAPVHARTTKDQVVQENERLAKPATSAKSAEVNPPVVNLDCKILQKESEDKVNFTVLEKENFVPVQDSPIKSVHEKNRDPVENSNILPSLDITHKSIVEFLNIGGEDTEINETNYEANEVYSPSKSITDKSLLSSQSSEKVNKYPSLTSILNAAPKKRITNRENAERRKRCAMYTDPPPRSEMTMVDLIFWNPNTSPMKNKKSETAVETYLDNDIIDLNPPPPKEAEEEEVDDNEYSAAPKVIINENGEIILDESSLVVQRKSTIDTTVEAIIENDDTSYTSFRRKMSKQWCRKETAKFYKALSLVGTDFALMEKILPNRSRRELKLKYKKEEKQNTELVHRAMYDCKTFDISILDEEEPDVDSPPIAEPKSNSKKARKRKSDEPLYYTSENGNDAEIDDPSIRKQNSSVYLGTTDSMSEYVRVNAEALKSTHNFSDEQIEANPDTNNQSDNTDEEWEPHPQKKKKKLKNKSRLNDFEEITVNCSMDITALESEDMCPGTLPAICIEAENALDQEQEESGMTTENTDIGADSQNTHKDLLQRDTHNLPCGTEQSFTSPEKSDRRARLIKELSVLSNFFSSSNAQNSNSVHHSKDTLSESTTVQSTSPLPVVKHCKSKNIKAVNDNTIELPPLPNPLLISNAEIARGVSQIASSAVVENPCKAFPKKSAEKTDDEVPFPSKPANQTEKSQLISPRKEKDVITPSTPTTKVQKAVKKKLVSPPKIGNLNKLSKFQLENEISLKKSIPSDEVLTIKAEKILPTENAISINLASDTDFLGSIEKSELPDTIPIADALLDDAIIPLGCETEVEETCSSNVFNNNMPVTQERRKRKLKEMPKIRRFKFCPPPTVNTSHLSFTQYTPIEENLKTYSRKSRSGIGNSNQTNRKSSGHKPSVSTATIKSNNSNEQPGNSLTFSDTTPLPKKARTSTNARFKNLLPTPRESEILVPQNVSKRTEISTSPLLPVSLAPTRTDSDLCSKTSTDMVSSLSTCSYTPDRSQTSTSSLQTSAKRSNVKPIAIPTSPQRDVDDSNQVEVIFAKSPNHENTLHMFMYRKPTTDNMTQPEM